MRIGRSPHFVRSIDAEHAKPGRQHIHNALHHGKTGPRQDWIILDNEA
jgi:hypothetical protein